MKTVFVLAFCVALAGSVAAEGEHPEKKKRGGQGEGGPQMKQHPQVTQQHLGKHAGNVGQHSFNNPAIPHPAGAKGHLRQTGPQFSAAHKGQFRGANASAGTAIHARHFDFTSQRSSNIASVKFSASRRIVGAEHWNGSQYAAFRVYRPQWHDRIWWTAHYPRIVLIGGGWYYWNAGFWYPAWGYDPGAAYYPYDGPIYGYNELPPDQVIANVQQALGDQGYYTGEVDGLLGPLTRAALAEYQNDHDLAPTSAIDEPTMASLGFTETAG